MIINCPRCGFRQPKDKYCASCGVDMEAFKPLRPSPLKKLFSSGFFQITVVVAFGILISLYLINFDKPQKWVQRITRYQPIKNNTASAKSEPFAANEQNKDSLANEPSAQPPTEIAVEVAPEVELSELANPGSNTASARSKVTSESDKNMSSLVGSKMESSFEISFVEVSLETLASWVQDSQNLGLYQVLNEDFSAGVLPQFRKRSDLDFKIASSNLKKLKIGKTENTLFGKTREGSSQFVGLQTNIALRSIDNNTSKGHFELIRQSAEFKDSLPTDFELQQGSVFFLHIKSLLAPFINDRNVSGIDLFNVLKSVDYQTQKTEIIIILEPK